MTRLKGDVKRVFQITNPARGRKLREKADDESHDENVSNHKPRKGTETTWLSREMSRLKWSFKSQTPQGDGNDKSR